MEQGDDITSINLYVCRYAAVTNGFTKLSNICLEHAYNTYDNLVIIDIEYDNIPKM